ncbi:MAG: putative Ig domain-containing protein [Methanobacteriota archaeon]
MVGINLFSFISRPIALDPRWGDGFTNTRITPAEGFAFDYAISEDGAGGIFITWRDGERGDNLFAQRMNDRGELLWDSNGIDISAGQCYHPHMIQDGSGGTIIVWEKYGTSLNIFAQRLDANGNKLWGANGIAVCTAAYTQQNPKVLLNYPEGAYIVWEDLRVPPGIYAQYVDMDGNIAWATNGIPLTTEQHSHWTPCMINDGTGGAIVTWSRLPTNPGIAVLYGQRINPTGHLMWGANGTMLCTQKSLDPTMIPDGLGGAIITWTGGPGWWDIYAQHINATGVPQWAVDGVPICINPENQFTPKIISDDCGGAIIVWSDMRTGIAYDIYGQRINESGVVQWVNNGIPICTGPENQWVSGMISDGGIGGAFITWYDDRTGNYDIYLHHIDRDGNSLWSPNGKAICSAPGSQNGPKIVSDSKGGAIVVWHDYSGPSFTYLCAQRIGVMITTSQPPLSVLEDQAYYYNFNSNDDNNITWSISTNASWLSFNPSTGILSGTPTNTHVGSYRVNVSIQGQGIWRDWVNYQLSVINVNDAPVIITSDKKTTSEDMVYYNDYEASDIDPMDILTWELTTNANWLGIDTGTGVVSGIPSNSQVGTYWVKVTVKDGNGGAAFHNFTLTVNNVNDPPIITTTDTLIASEDTLFYVDYNATDIDPTGDTVIWKLKSNATWISINTNSGILNGLPTNSDVGVNWVNVSCEDGRGGKDYSNFTLTVINSNDNPQITSTPYNTATEDTPYQYIVKAVDIDPTYDTLTWTLDTNATWLFMESTTGKLMGTPTNANVGNNWVNITASDGNGGICWQNYSLTVMNVNDRPTITVNNMVNATEDAVYSTRYKATDIDPTHDVFTWTLKTNASWLVINSNYGYLNGTPRNDDIGEYWVNITVSDGRNGYDHTNFTLSVLNVNDPPIIITDDVIISSEGAIYNVDYEANDLDPTMDILTWSLNTNASWLTIDPNSGLLTGTSRPGIFYVNVSVADGVGGMECHNFTLTVSSLSDTDGDGVPDPDDAFPDNPNEWKDTDGDGIEDNADTDDDGDGYLDIWEIFLGTNLLDPNDKPTDTDEDGKPDGDAANSQPWMDTDDDGDGIIDGEIFHAKDNTMFYILTGFILFIIAFLEILLIGKREI